MISFWMPNGLFDIDGLFGTQVLWNLHILYTASGLVVHHTHTADDM